MPELCIPKPRPSESERTLSLYRIAARWKIPVFYVRLKLAFYDVPLVQVAQPAVDGVTMEDLLEVERKIREEK